MSFRSSQFIAFVIISSHAIYISPSGAIRFTTGFQRLTTRVESVWFSGAVILHSQTVNED